MWLQYDHLLPHARGGNNEFDNLVITCAPCNYARGNHADMDDQRRPVRSSWDGFERFH